MKKILFFAIFYAVLSSNAQASRVELKNGQVLDGSILVEEENILYLETQGGVTNVPKIEIAKIDGNPVSYANDSASSAEPVGLKNWIVRVKDGGITVQEYQGYLERAGIQNGKDTARLTEEEKKQVLDQAIEDELLFQAALEAGVHKDEFVQNRMIERYREIKIGGSTNPNQFTEEEIQAFYDAHPKLFPTMIEIKAKIITFNSGIADEEVKKIKSDPAQYSWQETDWVSQKGESGKYLPVPEDQAAAIFALPKGAIQKFEGAMGGAFVVWVVDKKGGQKSSFSEARGKAKFELLNERLAREKRLNLSKDRTVLFERALQEGVHRDFFIRDSIIRIYLQNQNLTREAALPPLKQKFKVERS